ncbi:hypothetical protein Tco_0656649 [Tanacetum coccineum]|uniref:Uncharacterized protein n=1 Tax=Tanacetum coccineum TaxID=301880 RepID=A0ABQ4XA13_9ASTR
MLAPDRHKAWTTFILEITWNKKIVGISKFFGKIFEEHCRAILVQRLAKLMSKSKSCGSLEIFSPFGVKLVSRTCISRRQGYGVFGLGKLFGISDSRMGVVLGKVFGTSGYGKYEIG